MTGTKVSSFLPDKSTLDRSPNSFGNDNEVKRVKLAERRENCKERLGAEALEKINKNREFVETYEGKELFDDNLIEVRYTEQKGHHVVAKTDIPKGTLIMEEKAEFYRSRFLLDF